MSPSAQVLRQGSPGRRPFRRGAESGRHLLRSVETSPAHRLGDQRHVEVHPILPELRAAHRPARGRRHHDRARLGPLAGPGQGIQKQIDYLTQFGTPYPEVAAWGATIFELVGGLFLIVGVLTPIVGLGC